MEEIEEEGESVQEAGCVDMLEEDFRLSGAGEQEYYCAQGIYQ